MADATRKMAPKKAAAKKAVTKAATRKSPDSTDGAPVLEWIMAGLGLALVITALAVVLQGAPHANAPPELTARLTGVRPMEGGWVADVEVSNGGGRTAAQVQVEGVLGAETASATVDYVPSEGSQTVGLGFRQDPRAVELTVRGWVEP